MNSLIQEINFRIGYYLSWAESNIPLTDEERIHFMISANQWNQAKELVLAEQERIIKELDNLRKEAYNEYLKYNKLEGHRSWPAGEAYGEGAAYRRAIEIVKNE